MKTLYFSMILLIVFSFFKNSYADTSNQHFDNFLKEIRCVVCQNQSLADSHAPLAEDLRNKINSMMKANKSDDEIKEYLVNRYGEFILFNPRLSHLTILLWGFPFMCLLIGCFFIYYRNK